MKAIILKLMGDSTLKTLTYQYLFREGKTAEIETMAQRIFPNAPGLPMDMKSICDEMMAVEKDKIESYRNCHVVQAPIGYS